MRPTHLLLLRNLFWCASLVVALAACSRPDAPLQPVYRLTDVLEQKPAKDVPKTCDIADEFRVAIGCMGFIPMGKGALPRPEDGTIPFSAIVTPPLATGMIVAEPRVRGKREDWRRTPAVVLPKQGIGKVDLKVPVPAEVKGDKIDVQVFGRPVPPTEQTHITRPLKIGRDAKLSLGIGLDPLGNRVGAVPVVFRVLAETADGTTELMREVLDPRADKGWRDRVFDLRAFAGQRVRFHLETRVVVDGVSRMSQVVGFPLWGAPQVLEPRPRDGRRNVILISLDTMRGDQLGGSLNGIPLMPGLVERAQSGATFENAYTTYPSTTAGHMTMFTGLYPATHGMVFATGVLSPDITTLPEIFSRNGYATAAVTEDAMLTAHVGFARGFDYYREFKGQTMWQTTGEIEQTFGAGLKWIEDHPDERFFLFLHTYQVHSPYEPPPAYDLFKTYERDGQQVPIDKTTKPAIADRHRYAGEVVYTDAVLSKLLDRLAELGLRDETIVVVTADHGDEFGEHDQIGHAKTAYDEVIHVPLVMLAPGLIPGGKEITTPVSLIDLAPTLLDLTRLPIPKAMQGVSLRPLLRGDSIEPRVLYAEAPAWGAGTGHRVAARTARFKWIHTDLPDAPLQAFDLTTDPTEHAPITDDPHLLAPGEVLVRLYRSLGDTRKSVESAKSDPIAPVPTPRPELDDATIQKLRQLGYID